MANAVSLPRLIERHSPNQSSRHGAGVRLVVVHETVGSYLGSVSWLCNPDAQASAHVVLNEHGTEATQLVPWNEKAWHVAACNPFADGIELAHVPGEPWNWEQLRVAARIVAFRLRRRKLPGRWTRSPNGHGFIRHKDLGALGGGHHDPTMSPALWLRFVFQVGHEYRRGHFRAVWGSD